MLSLQNIVKKFPNITAVDNVSLEIERGEMVGIIGSSGAGKSTLLRIINKLTSSTSGRIYFHNKDISDLKGRRLLDWRSTCGMIFQQFNLVHRLDVLSNVLMGRLRKHSTLKTLFMMFSDQEKTGALEALERVGILDQALKRCDQLSGGQQQRVAIARALVQEPEIILADEPIASLDPRSAKKVMEILADINERDRITVIVSLHDIAAARTFCRRIIGMTDGRVVFDGSGEQLTDDVIRRIYSSSEEEDRDLLNSLPVNREVKNKHAADPVKV